MKTPEQQFADWEGHVFGYGYGSGERPVLDAVKAFFAVIPASGNYDYEAIERALTAPVAWLLINRFCQADVIEYGTSPRFGWLTNAGKALKAFVDAHDLDDLERMTAGKSDDVPPCYPDACNCGPNGYESGKKCVNPFWGSFGPSPTAEVTPASLPKRVTE